MSLVEQLRSASDLKDVIPILRSIKNYLTGHELRKIECIRAGLIQKLWAHVSAECGNEEDAEQDDEDEEDDVEVDLEIQMMMTESAHIIGIIANSGPAFCQPVLDRGLPELLVRYLRRDVEIRSVLAVLRCLNVVVDNLPLATANSWTSNTSITDLLQNQPAAACLTRIVKSEENTFRSRQASEAALALICKTAVDDKSRALYVRAGLLDDLCHRLAACVTAQGLTPVSAEANAIADHKTSSAPALRTKLAHTLEGLCLLTERSRSTCTKVVKDPTLLKALSWPHTAAQLVRTTPWGRNVLQPAPAPPPTPLETRLPKVPDVEGQREAEKSSYPPLSAVTPSTKRRTLSSNVGQSGQIPNDSTSSKEPTEQQLIPYLLLLVREMTGSIQSLAAWLLAILHSHGFVGAARLRSMSFLVVPILVDAIRRTYNSVDSDEEQRTLTGLRPAWLAPITLAWLIRDNEVLQKAAFDNRAIPGVCLALKTNFTSNADVDKPLWWPKKQSMKTTSGPLYHSLGLGGPTLQARQEMQLREGLLQFLAAIAPFDDKYRALICEHRAMDQITLALQPFSSNITQTDSADHILVKGNSASTVLAACGAVRALTRSPTALRTKLVDADVAQCIINLIHSNEPQLRIAATAVVANLAHDFSPMKSSISDAAVVSKLCEQAHSANARLRFESVFALKSLVARSDYALKKLVVDGLGADWIRVLIATDPRDIPAGEVIGLDSKSYIPLSNARFQEGFGEVSMDSSSDITNLDPETDYNHHTVEDDFEIQEQLLAFIRNLFSGDDCHTIVDYLLTEVGEDDFIDILTDRLKERPRSIIGLSQNAATQINVTPPGTILNTLYVIVHLAATEPKWRQKLISRRALIQQVTPYFSSPDDRIRACCCWLTINLLWLTVNESPDQIRERARVLRGLGFMRECQRLEANDPSLDVRERAKTAMQCFIKLLAP